MAKKYTRAQWERLQSSLPEEDRVPYEMSPDKDTTEDVGFRQAAAKAKQPAAEQITGLEQGTGRDSRRAIAPSPRMTTSELEINRDSRRAASTSPILTDTAEYRAGERGYQAVQPTGPVGGTEPAGGMGAGTGDVGAGAGGGAGAGAGGAGGGGGGNEPSVVTYTASDGTKFTDREVYLEYEATLRGERKGRQSAFDLLYQEFAGYGLGSLVEPLRGLIEDPSISSSEFTLRLRGTDTYKKRFAANAKRIAKGLTALNEAEYLSLEDQYQNVMRKYGLPPRYYTKDALGVQSGLESLIAADVSSVELEDRVQLAYDRVINAAPEVKASLRAFYPNISDGDILAYALDPESALTDIKRKVTAAEIGAGAVQAGLATGVQRAEELARLGITGEQARTGFQTVAGIAPRGRQLSAFYKEEPLTQTDIESEVFGTTGAVEAKKRRERLVGREIASFSGSAGTTQGALARERAGQF